MQINGVTIIDTFAEAFPMWAARLVITADTLEWATIAAHAATGLAISVVGCRCEADLDCEIKSTQTPDGRPGLAVLFFGMNEETLAKELLKRVGQGVLTTPTSACFNGLESIDKIRVGGKLRYFGDGHQSSKLLDGNRYWRIPVADGEFIVEESFGITKAVGGGNIIIFGLNRNVALEAAMLASKAIRNVAGAIAPFPGGVCRSPSKVGSRYKELNASTNHNFCPTLRGVLDLQIPDDVQGIYEIVIDGLNEQVVASAMREAVIAACRPGVKAITAANYGGMLGQYHFHLHQILSGKSICD